MSIGEPAIMWSGRFREPLNRTFEQWQRDFPFDWCLLTLSALFALTGCHAHPDKVVTFTSPDQQVVYTVETSYGPGPVSNDYTDVYAAPQGSPKAKQLALNGPYLEDTAVRWASPTDVDFCIGHGRTIEFRNWLTLTTRDGSNIDIHEHLNEGCATQGAPR